MIGFPFEVAGRRVTSADQLRDLLRSDAHGGPLRRQDVHPAEAWRDAMEGSRAIRDAVEHLLVELIGVEDDPRVLGMIAVLATNVSGLVAEAVARRIADGPPIPDAPGVQFARVAEDLRHVAQGVDDPALKARLAATGNPLDTLRAKIDTADPGMVDALVEAVAAGDVPVPVVGTVATLVGLMFPDQLVKAAKAVKKLSEAHRAAFLRDALSVAPKQKAKIEKALG